jgi:hypothetical protein
LLRHPATRLVAVALVLLLAGCASGLEVRSDVDPSADFDRYQTWNFFDQLGVEGGYNSPIYGELFRESITAEMNKRGYRQEANPDLYVNVTIRGDDKVKMKSYTSPYMSGAYYHRPGGPYYGSAVGVGVGSVSRATKVTEASIFIDLVDNSTDRLVWQGVAVAEANDETAQNLRNAVFTAVDRTFQLYPHTAGL